MRGRPGGGGVVMTDLSILPFKFKILHQEKIYLMLRRAVTNIHEGFGRVEPEDAHRPVGLVGQQQRHRPVQAAAAVHVISEGVQVIKTIGFPVSVKATEFHNQHPSVAQKRPVNINEDMWTWCP